jgi:hypothetical protein
MTTKNFNRLYTILIVLMAFGLGMVIGGSITALTTFSMIGFTILLGGFTSCVVLYTIETTK